MSSEAILENPGIFSGGPVVANRQVVLANEYLASCRQHPVHHYRTIRSHLQKMLFRYCTKNTALRDSINVAKEIHEFQDIVDSCHSYAELPENAEVDFDQESWYSRHRNPAHMHSGRVANTEKINTSRFGLIYEKEGDCHGGGRTDEDEDGGIGLGAMFG